MGHRNFAMRKRIFIWLNVSFTLLCCAVAFYQGEGHLIRQLLLGIMTGTFPLVLFRITRSAFRSEEASPKTTKPLTKDSLRFWELLAYILPREAREQIYLNLVDELKIDSIELRSRCSCPHKLRFAKVLFGIRAFWYFGSTLAQAAQGALLKTLLGIWRIFAG